MTTTIRRRSPARPDLWDRYPDARLNFRPTMFGLSRGEYVAEYRRRQAEGWATWELSARLPRPEQVAV